MTPNRPRALLVLALVSAAFALSGCAIFDEQIGEVDWDNNDDDGEGVDAGADAGLADTGTGSDADTGPPPVACGTACPQLDVSFCVEDERVCPQPVEFLADLSSTITGVSPLVLRSETSADPNIRAAHRLMVARSSEPDTAIIIASFSDNQAGLASIEAIEFTFEASSGLSALESEDIIAYYKGASVDFMAIKHEGSGANNTEIRIFRIGTINGGGGIKIAQEIILGPEAAPAKFPTNASEENNIFAFVNSGANENVFIHHQPRDITPRQIIQIDKGIAFGQVNQRGPLYVTGAGIASVTEMTPSGKNSILDLYFQMNKVNIFQDDQDNTIVGVNWNSKLRETPLNDTCVEDLNAAARHAIHFLAPPKAPKEREDDFTYSAISAEGEDVVIISKSETLGGDGRVCLDDSPERAYRVEMLSPERFAIGFGPETIGAEMASGPFRIARPSYEDDKAINNVLPKPASDLGGTGSEIETVQLTTSVGLSDKLHVLDIAPGARRGEAEVLLLDAAADPPTLYAVPIAAR